MVIELAFVFVCQTCRLGHTIGGTVRGHGHSLVHRVILGEERRWMRPSEKRHGKEDHRPNYREPPRKAREVLHASSFRATAYSNLPVAPHEIRFRKSARGHNCFIEIGMPRDPLGTAASGRGDGTGQYKCE